MSGLGGRLADCDAAHFGCEWCEKGVHDRPDLHADVALAWFAEVLADEGLREAVARVLASTPAQHEERFYLTSASRALAAVRDHLGRVGEA